LVWVFHDVRWSELFVQVKTMNPWLLIPAILADIGGYVTQGARWSLLLRPLGRLSTRRATHAIYAGLFLNEMLPLRVGEILRGYLATRRTSLSMTQVFSSIFVERFLDAVWLVLAVGIVILGVPLPHYLVSAEESLAGGTFLAAALLVYLVVRKGRELNVEGSQPEAGARARRPGRLQRMIGQVARALQSIGGSASFYGAAVLSGLLLVLFAAAFWLVMLAYGLSLSVWQGAAIFLIMHIGTAVPSAPSNIGTYQFFTVLGLTLFGVDKTVASGFSVVVYLILTAPLWIIGLVAFGRSGLSLRTVLADLSEPGKDWGRQDEVMCPAASESISDRP
jgi:hypothetical protein